MSTYQWLCLLGIPGILATMLGYVGVQYKQIKAIKLGLQALLRDRLLQAYEFYGHRGWANYDEKQNIQNIYMQYEALGPNGIMHQKHMEFIRLPDEARNNDGGTGT